MTRISRSGRVFIFLGDIVLLYGALFAALFIRYPTALTGEIIRIHLIPFSALFLLWIGVFLIAGLYEKHVRLRRNRLPSTIFKVQVANSLLAVVFFYAFPYVGIAPKVTLFIYLVISFFFITLWRMYGPLLLGDKSEQAIFVAHGSELDELVNELRNNTGYYLQVATSVDLDKVADPLNAVRKAVHDFPEANVIVADLEDPRMKNSLGFLYDLVSEQYIYLEIYAVYEDIFKRLPVSLLDERWLIQNVSLLPSRLYDIGKRAVDVVVGIMAFIVSLPFYVLVYVLIKLDDGGPIFFVHDRVGQYDKPVKIVKFRSFGVHNEQDGIAKQKTITRVGGFLRKSRIDELPQLWNVIKGDLSLIGPRSELPKLVSIYEKEIPYYSLRYIVKPGLSGWAQINQKTPPKFIAEVEATKQKVAYDLFYVKHRSLILDMLIALQTIRELLSSKGI